MKRYLVFAAFVLCCSTTWGRELQVPSVDYNSIQSAIDDANDDDVVTVAAGTYQENIDFLGKAITVRSANPDDPNVVAATIIDGSNSVDPNYGTVVIFRNGEDANSVLSGFTITGGTGSWLAVSWEFQGLRWNRCGGGVVCYNMSAPTISKNIFVNNTAGQGGGIYIYGDPVDPNDPSNPAVHVSPVITDNTFINNSAAADHNFAPPDTNYPANDHGDGGAIVGFQGCDAVITGNLIENNHAGSYGGGVHLRQWSNGLIGNNDIIGNDSPLGAGIHITYTSAPNVVDNLIQANRMDDLYDLGGGGIYVYYYSDPLIERNTITQNESANGAGIAVIWASDPVIRNNLIVNNVNGAGVRIKGGSVPVITNNTIVGNTASSSYGGGVDCLTDSSPIIVNNIIASNGSSYGIYSLAGMPLPVVRYNNVWGNGAGNYNSVIGDQTGINGNISVEPNFVNPDSNDYSLNYSSKCINAGDPNYLPDSNETDYHGDERIMGQYIDIGADEAWPVWNVTSGGRYDSIQSGVDDSNDGDIIIVTTGTHTGDGNRDIDFSGKAITVQSVDPNDPDVVASTIIDCQGSVLERHRGFNFHSGEDLNSVVSGLTVTGGGGAYRGAICCIFGSSPTIKNCIITNNSMRDHGGGFYCGFGSNPAITNCIISSNTFTTVGYGGGIYCYESSPTITNCIITNNSAVDRSRHGGGICCFINGDPVVANCIISGNSAPQRGGGLHADFSNPTLVNCTVIGNKSLQGGGVSSFEYSNPSVINCIVRDNRAPDGNQLALINPRFRGLYPEMLTEMTVSFSNIQGGEEGACVDPNMILHWGDGNIDVDSNFVDSGYWDDANTPADTNDDFFVSGDYHLYPDSPCIDAGDNNSVPEGVTDFDGNPRFVDADCNCTYTVDMGVYEFGYIGDFDCDRSVNMADFGILALSWLTGAGDGQWNPCCDISIPTDDYIDWLDVDVFRRHWLEGTE